jgi:superoxide dismutase
MNHRDKFVKDEDRIGDGNPWYWLSLNQNLTFDIIVKNQDKPFYWRVIEY